MAPGPVVLHFDVLEKGLAQSIAVHQWHTVDAFDLQAVEEALHHRIDVAVTSAAHTGRPSRGNQPQRIRIDCPPS